MKTKQTMKKTAIVNYVNGNMGYKIKVSNIEVIDQKNDIYTDDCNDYHVDNEFNVTPVDEILLEQAPIKKEAIEGELYEIFLNVDRAEFALRQVLKVRQSEKSKKAHKLLSEAHRLMEDDHQEWCEELGLE